MPMDVSLLSLPALMEEIKNAKIKKSFIFRWGALPIEGLDHD